MWETQTLWQTVSLLCHCGLARSMVGYHFFQCTGRSHLCLDASRKETMCAFWRMSKESVWEQKQSSISGTKRKCIWPDCLDLLLLPSPFFASVRGRGWFRIISRVTLKVNERATGKCWGSGAMLDIFGPYSSTGRQAAGLPFQLLSPPMLSFSLSLSFGVFSHFTDGSADGQWRIGWVLVSRCLICAGLPLVGDDGTMTLIVAFTMNFRRSRTSITSHILDHWHEEAGIQTESATFLIVIAT